MPTDTDARISRLLDQLDDPTLPASRVEELQRRIDYLRENE